MPPGLKHSDSIRTVSARQLQAHVRQRRCESGADHDEVCYRQGPTAKTAPVHAQNTAPRGDEGQFQRSRRCTEYGDADRLLGGERS